MIQRQWCVENIVVLKIGHVVNAGRNENVSGMCNDGSFWKSSCSGCVDV